MPYGRPVERVKQWTGWALWIVGVGLLLGLTAGLASASVRAHRARIEQGYATQAELMVATYAQASGRWWLRGDVETMAEAARLMVVGSARFACVVVGNEALVDLRDADVDERSTLVPEGGPREAPLVTRRAIGGAPVLDVIVPIPVTGFDRPIGTVRVGFELTSVARQTRARAWGTAGIATACDAASIGMIAALAVLRRRRRGRTGRGDAGSDRTLVRGELRIDPLSKVVTVCGEPLELTPKQFDLLLLLAEVPDRVLSDDDILAAVWTESPYADSRDVKQCVYTLRRRLGRVLENPSNVVVNVKGYGYKLAPPDDEAVVDSS